MACFSVPALDFRDNALRLYAGDGNMAYREDVQTGNRQETFRRNDFSETAGNSVRMGDASGCV